MKIYTYYFLFFAIVLSSSLFAQEDCQVKLASALEHLRSLNQEAGQNIYINYSTTSYFTNYQGALQSYQSQLEAYINGKRAYYNSPEAELMQDEKYIVSILKKQQAIYITDNPQQLSKPSQGAGNQLYLLQDSLLRVSTIIACSPEMLGGVKHQKMKLRLPNWHPVNYLTLWLGPDQQVKKTKAEYRSGNIKSVITEINAFKVGIIAPQLKQSAKDLVMNKNGVLKKQYQAYQLFDQSKI